MTGCCKSHDYFNQWKCFFNVALLCYAKISSWHQYQVSWIGQRAGILFWQSYIICVVVVVVAIVTVVAGLTYLFDFYERDETNHNLNARIVTTFKWFTKLMQFECARLLNDDDTYIQTMAKNVPRWQSVRPDWAIYWTLSSFSKPLATFYLPHSLAIL